MRSKRSQRHNDEVVVRRLRSLLAEVDASQVGAGAQATYIRALKGASAEQALAHLREGGRQPVLVDIECATIEKLARLSGHHHPVHVRVGAVNGLARVFRRPPTAGARLLAVNLCGVPALCYIAHSLVHWANSHTNWPAVGVGGTTSALIAYNTLAHVINGARESIAQGKHPHRLSARSLSLSREEVDAMEAILAGEDFRDFRLWGPGAPGSRVIPFLAAHAIRNEATLNWMMRAGSEFNLGNTDAAFLARVALAADLPDIYGFATRTSPRPPRADALNAAAQGSSKVVAHIVQSVGEGDLALSVIAVPWIHSTISSFAGEDGLRLGSLHAWLDNVPSDRQLFLDMITQHFPPLVLEFLAEDFGQKEI